MTPKHLLLTLIFIVFLYFVNSEDTGKTTIMAKVPDTITSWIASAFAMSEASGLGVSKPTSLKVFQPFFVSLTLPYSVIRGEEVSIITTVFNYEKKCLTVSLRFLNSFLAINYLPDFQLRKHNKMQLHQLHNSCRWYKLTGLLPNQAKCLLWDTTSSVHFTETFHTNRTHDKPVFATRAVQVIQAHQF